jgi:hypothetical protein
LHAEKNIEDKKKMSKNIINRKRKVQQAEEADELSSTSSDSTIVAVVAPKVRKAPGPKKADTPSYTGALNGTLQDLHDQFGCEETLKCKGCQTVFDGSKRMRFHKLVGNENNGQEDQRDAMYKCDHNTKECKTTTYLVVKRLRQ